LLRNGVFKGGGRITTLATRIQGLLTTHLVRIRWVTHTPALSPPSQWCPIRLARCMVPRVEKRVQPTTAEPQPPSHLLCRQLKRPPRRSHRPRPLLLPQIPDGPHHLHQKGKPPAWILSPPSHLLVLRRWNRPRTCTTSSRPHLLPSPRNLMPSTTPGSRHGLATAIGIHQTRILEPPGLSLLPLWRLGQRSYHL